MKLTLTSKELDKLYDFTRKLNTAGANKVFNAMFTNNHNEMIDLNVIQTNDGNRQLQLDIDQDVAVAFIDAFINNAPSMGCMFKSGTFNLLVTAKSIWENLSVDIRTALHTATKIFNRKKETSSSEEESVECNKCVNF